MQRITLIERAGEWEGESAPATDMVRLDHDQRSRRRMVFHSDGGRAMLLDLARPAGLRGGDAFRLEDGTRVVIAATDEALLEIGAASMSALVRIAWHLGNRHLPTQLVPGDDGGTLRIRQDHVIAEMAAGLGGTVTAIKAPFDPEGGAYAGGGHGHHGHDHGDNLGHDHDHHHHADHVHEDGHCDGHDHGHSHDNDPGHDHHHPAHSHG